MKKVILGGLLGGVVLFVWGAISHMALPLGTVGLRSMPPALEPAVLGAMQSGMSERALYFFPGLDLSKKMTDEEQQAWNLKYQAGPPASWHSIRTREIASPSRPNSGRSSYVTSWQL
jgi:hypothetical protein